MFTDYISFRLSNLTDVEEARDILTSIPGKRNWSIIQYPCVRRILLSSQIRDALHKVFDRDEQFHLTSLSTNRSSDEPGKWHTDHPYCEGLLPEDHPCWPVFREGKPVSVQLLITLSDFTGDNGATEYISGSRHTWIADFDNVQKIIEPFGTVIMYQGNLWHRTGPNKSGKDRMAILANFSLLPVAPLITENPISTQIRPNDPDFVLCEGKVRLNWFNCSECEKPMVFEQGDQLVDIGPCCYGCCNSEQDYIRLKMKKCEKSNI